MTFITSPASGILSTGNTSTANVPGANTLNGGIDDIVTTITLTSAAEFPSGGGIVKINSEYISYTGVAGNDLTGCVRGDFDSTAASHLSGDAVSGVFIGAKELNVQPDVMVSLKSDQGGVEYFDFSNDGTSWDTFPVTGFTVATFHEFHIAVKGRRYFRIRFENGSSSATTSFRVYTYYGVFRQGNLPLNQSIGDDSDSTIVRAVQTGADPDGTYVNNPVSGIDGSNSTSTSATTTLNDAGGISSGDTTIVVTDASDAGIVDGSYIRIGSEIIRVGTVATNTLSSCTRGALGTTAASHADGVDVERLTHLAGTTMSDAGGINSTDATIGVADGSDFSDGDYILIDSEIIQIGTVNVNSLEGCTRGVLGTVAASHADGVNVGGVFAGSFSNVQQFHGISVLLDGNAVAACPGTLYMQFSHDGKTIHRNITVVTADIAATAPRTLGVVAANFRVIYGNTSSATCTLEAQTMYHMVQVGLVSRLDDTIGDNTDVSNVRSIIAGLEPDGSYSNIKKGGSAFSTTSNLQGTTLGAGITDSQTGNISVTSTTGFGATGYIYIGSELIEYDQVVNPTTLNIPVGGRGAFGTTAAAHSLSDVIGEAFVSDVLELKGYTEVATKILSSNTGQGVFQWYSDLAATDAIRTISPPYSTAGTYDYLAAPNFGPYVRYIFANTESSATTDLYFETEFYTNSISAQVLTVNSTILPQMTSNLTRSVIVGKQPDGDFVNLPSDGNAFSTSATLGAGGSYTSAWQNTNGYNIINLFVASDVVSADGGLVVEFTDDVQAGVPTVRGSRVFTFSSSNVANGSRVIDLATALGGFRVSYTNNATTGQSSFYLDATLKTNGQVRQSNLDSNLAPDELVTDVRAVIAAQKPQGDYANIESSFGNALDVSLVNPQTAFGEVSVAEATPIIQHQFSYYNGDVTTNNLFFIRRMANGVAVGSNGQISLGSGDIESSHCIYQSKQVLAYRPGQGVVIRGTASFSPTRTDNIQEWGFGDGSNGFFFSNDGSNFNVMRRSGGQQEIRELKITAGPTGNTTAVITLDGVKNYVDILAADTIGQVVTKIATSPFIPWENIGEGWDVYKDVNTIRFVSTFPESLAGTYSFANGGDATLAGTFSQLIAGSQASEEVIPQSSWDDPCDGTVVLPSIDFSTGNVFEIDFQWLGYGQIRFRIENPLTGRFSTVHSIKYANTAGVPTMANPNGFLYMRSENKVAGNSTGSFSGTTGGAPPDINQTNDTIDVNSHGFSDGDFVSYDNGGGTSISGLTENYTAPNIDANADISSESIVLPGHGLRHTEQVLYQESVGGQPIGGLTSGTRYYVIYRNEDSIQLATSLANAQAGTNIVITANGSGGATDTLQAARFYVVNSTTNTFKLALTPGGAAIDIGDGTGVSHRLFEAIESPNYITVDGSSGSVITGNAVNFTAHGFVDNEAVFYENYSGGTDISGLVGGEVYYVVNSTANTFQLAAVRSGDVITLAVGTGVEHQFIQNVVLSSASFAGFIQGQSKSLGQTYSVSGRSQTTSGATEYPLLAIKVKNNYLGLNNRIRVTIKQLSFGYSKTAAADKEATAKFQFYLNPDISTDTDPSFTDVDTGVSVCEFSTLDAAATISNGQRIGTQFIALGGQNLSSLPGAILSPGDMLVVSGSSPSSQALVLDCAANWTEDL